MTTTATQNKNNEDDIVKPDNNNSFSALSQEPNITVEDVEKALNISDNDEAEEGPDMSLSAEEFFAGSLKLLELLALFYKWWELVLILKLSSNNYQATKILAETVVDETDSTNKPVNISAAVNVPLLLDKVGRVVKEGLMCPECGKSVKNLKAGGFCSAECAVTFASKKVMAFAMAPNDKYKEFQKCVNDLIAILDLMNLIINAIMTIPSIIGELSVLPKKYKDWVNIKLNEGFCYLYQCILKLMVAKNNVIIFLLKPLKWGWIAKPMKAVFASIEAIVAAMQVVKDAFDKGYKAAVNAINSVEPTGLCIKGNGMSWLCSPRSYISPFPSLKPDANKIFVDLKNGAGLYDVKAMLLPSQILNVQVSEIEATILASFPPLTPADYYLEPELFKVRYLFSDQSDLVRLVKLALEDLLVAGPDYLPKFENMLPAKKYTITIDDETMEVTGPNLAYTYFIAGLLDGWAPHGKAYVGSVILPQL